MTISLLQLLVSPTVQWGELVTVNPKVRLALLGSVHQWMFSYSFSIIYLLIRVLENSLYQGDLSVDMFNTSELI